VQLLYSGVLLCEESYTLQQYAQYVLADESMESYHGMVRQMLHYGGAAQCYFDYNTTFLADAGLAEGSEAEIPQSVQQELTVQGQLQGIALYGATLNLRHKVAVRYYFAVSGDLAEHTFTANGKIYEPVAKDGLCYIELAGVNPQDWDAQQVLTVSDGNGNTLTVGYSPMNYIQRMYAKGADSLSALLKAMYNYHLAAKEFCTE
jgi:hypothetical protein